MYVCMYIYILTFVCMYIYLHVCSCTCRNKEFFNIFIGHDTKHDQEIEAKNKPIIHDLNMGVFRFSLDAMHMGKFIPNFSLLECTNVAITVDATKVYFMYICVCKHVCIHMHP
jgi:hypothetical protein